MKTTLLMIAIIVFTGVSIAEDKQDATKTDHVLLGYKDKSQETPIQTVLYYFGAFKLGKPDETDKLLYAKTEGGLLYKRSIICMAKGIRAFHEFEKAADNKFGKGSVKKFYTPPYRIEVTISSLDQIQEEINGEKATVIPDKNNKEKTPIQLIKIDNKWYIDSDFLYKYLKGLSDEAEVYNRIRIGITMMNTNIDILNAYKDKVDAYATIDDLMGAFKTDHQDAMKKAFKEAQEDSKH